MNISFKYKPVAAVKRVKPCKPCAVVTLLKQKIAEITKQINYLDYINSGNQAEIRFARSDVNHHLSRQFYRTAKCISKDLRKLDKSANQILSIRDSLIATRKVWEKDLLNLRTLSNKRRNSPVEFDATGWGQVYKIEEKYKGELV